MEGTTGTGSVFNYEGRMVNWDELRYETSMDFLAVVSNVIQTNEEEGIALLRNSITTGILGTYKMRDLYHKLTCKYRCCACKRDNRNQFSKT